MSPSRRRRAVTPTPKKKRPASIDNSKALSVRKHKSVRLQHSISLHIPLDELDDTTNGLNTFIDLPQQVFSLTYLEVDNTQNPESLLPLEEFRKCRWQIHLGGFLYNFNYTPEQIRSLRKELQDALIAEFGDANPNTTYHTEVSVSEELNPTENDSLALVITVHQSTGEKETLSYKGYLISWCNPANENRTLLPILMCRGPNKYIALVHRVMSEKFNVDIKKLILTQEDFMVLTAYCIIMLHENDCLTAQFSYVIPPGTISISVEVKYLLKLWKKIHKDESNEIELDDVLLFHDALEAFYESTYGLKLGYAHFKKISIKGFLLLDTNSQIWCNSTRIIHVVLKYLNYLAVQKLKVRSFNSFLQNSTTTSLV